VFFPYFTPFLTEKWRPFWILRFFFNFFFHKAQLDPGRVIVWKFEGHRSSGLVATRGTHIHTYTDTHKVNNRTNLFQQSWFLNWSLNYCWRFPKTLTSNFQAQGTSMFSRIFPNICVTWNVILKISNHQGIELTQYAWSLRDKTFILEVFLCLKYIKGQIDLF